MKILRRFEVWIIIMAVVVSLVISCSGCTRAEPVPGKAPQPSRTVARYSILGNQVVEFRASNGNICVFIASGYSGLLDCSPPLPPLNYEDLPSVEGEQQ